MACFAELIRKRWRHPRSSISLTLDDNTLQDYRSVIKGHGVLTMELVSLYFL